MPIPFVSTQSGEESGRAALGMAAQSGQPEKRLDLRRAQWAKDSLGVEGFLGFRRESLRMNRASAGRSTGTIFGERTESALLAAAPFQRAHRAVMLAVPAAARGQIRLGIRGEEGRDRRPTEQHRQRKCDRAAHGQTTSLIESCRRRMRRWQCPMRAGRASALSALKED